MGSAVIKEIAISGTLTLVNKIGASEGIRVDTMLLLDFFAHEDTLQDHFFAEK